MNRELMLKVADHIEAHPDNYDQTTWFRQINGTDDIKIDGYVKPTAVVELNICDTAACVAGWAVTIALKADPAKSIDLLRTAHAIDHEGDLMWNTAGAVLLDLDTDIADDLFDHARNEIVMPTLLRRLAALTEPLDSYVIEAIEGDLEAELEAQGEERTR